MNQADKVTLKESNKKKKLNRSSTVDGTNAFEFVISKPRL